MKIQILFEATLTASLFGSRFKTFSHNANVSSNFIFNCGKFDSLK